MNAAPSLQSITGEFKSAMRYVGKKESEVERLKEDRKGAKGGIAGDFCVILHPGPSLLQHFDKSGKEESLDGDGGVVGVERLGYGHEDELSSMDVVWTRRGRAKRRLTRYRAR